MRAKNRLERKSAYCGLTLEVSGRGRNAASLAQRAVRGPLGRIVRVQHATKEPETQKHAGNAAAKLKR